MSDWTSLYPTEPQPLEEYLEGYLAQYLRGDCEAYRVMMNFRTGEGVCYVPLQHDLCYTHADFLRITGGNKADAAELFDWVEWEAPETAWIEIEKLKNNAK